MFSDNIQRYPTKAGRQALAARLGLSIAPYSQDWEYEVAHPDNFQNWLDVYRTAPLSDDERFSLMMMLIQCVDDYCQPGASPEQVERLREWQDIAALLRAAPQLHASTVHYWSLLDDDDPGMIFPVSLPMRRVWDEVQRALV